MIEQPERFVAVAADWLDDAVATSTRDYDDAAGGTSR